MNPEVNQEETPEAAIEEGTGAVRGLMVPAAEVPDPEVNFLKVREENSADSVPKRI